MIYFIQASITGLIKIGHTRDLKERFKAIESICSEKIYIIKTTPGDLSAEHKLHIDFSHLRDHSEWFHPGKDLLKYIANVKTLTMPSSLAKIS